MSSRLYLPNRPRRGVVCAYVPCDPMTRTEMEFPLVKGAAIQLWRYTCVEHLPKSELHVEAADGIINWMLLLSRSPEWYRRNQTPMGHGSVVSIDSSAYLLVQPADVTGMEKHMKLLRRALYVSDDFMAVHVPYTYAQDNNEGVV